LKRSNQAGKAGKAGAVGRTRSVAVTLALALTLAASLRLLAAASAVDQAFDQFWSANAPDAAANAIDAVVKSGISFDDALVRLKKGRRYRSDVPRGVVKLSHRIGADEFPYMLDVPETYDAAKKYQVRIQLHGGVGRPDATPRGNGIGQLAGVEQIYILPTAWSEAEWWTNRQLENLQTILDRVKRTYNVDENHVVLSGVSDGGTGTYYFSMRDTTPFASFLPLNGAVAVLRSANVSVDGELFPNNFLNKPFLIVNGGRDPLYPTSLVEPYIRHMAEGGVTVKYLPQPDAVHNTAWWPEVKDVYEAFVREHPRTPLPDKLTWETDLAPGTNRAHWLVIEKLAKPTAEAVHLPDLNDLVSAPVANFGIAANGTRVNSVVAGSNAEAFGVEPDDVILRINGRMIPGGVDVVDLLSTYDAGTKLVIVVSRQNEPFELQGVFSPVATPRVVPMFAHRRPTGRVDLVRDGNTVTATTRTVDTFTLLLSPEIFDFTKPLRVVANGKTVFDGRVTRSLPTLLKWAARDNDRTMLFGAEVTVKLAE
jgi:poly(3-hydroxybutyrate) depolymerase